MSRVVQAAKKASSAQLISSLQDTHTFRDSTFKLQVLKASDLSLEERDDVWRIFENNMQKELYHSASRFIIVRGDSGEVGDSNATQGGACHLVAFSMFRFDREFGVNQIYCYELQVCKSLRRSGLGSHLMRQLLSLGRDWRMEKVILTVFKANMTAMQFYNATGFTIDPTSPGYVSDGELAPEDDDEENVDYVIMSRAVRT
ncbi:acyl-CoA N-acyltransferase [Amylocystis lapponica]|nr:acyl-CoA N-acyltransferase [Amylocystis lapponica]